MTRSRLLPAQLGSVFSVAHAVAIGVPRGRLTRADLSSPFYGVRSAHPVASDDELRARCLEYAPRLAAWQFFSHETALAIVGAPMPEWPYRPCVHVSAHRPAREPRTAGVAGHRLQTREAAISTTADGLRIEHPVRAWRQAGVSWTLGALVAAGDFLVSGERPFATAAELREEVEQMGDVRGGLLRQALALVRVGPRSPRESLLRLVLGRFALPEPEINWILRTARGDFIAEIDLAYVRWRVAVEYDGRVHAEDAAQFEKDADRWDRIRAAGWQHVRILNHHLGGDGAIAAEKVRRALVQAGWRPTPRAE